MNFIYTCTIYPLELIYNFIYFNLVDMSGNYSISLILLALVSFLFLQPLSKLVAKIQTNQNILQDVLAPQIQKIKKESTGAEQHQRIENLYKRYSYHPIYALRSVLGLFIQVPFLMAAYYMLSTYAGLEGQQFGPIKNLAKPDSLFLNINVLPIFMTLINIVTVFTTTGTSKSSKVQSVVISILFFIILYNAPSALLVYWTTNNFLFLIKSIVPQKGKSNFLIQAVSNNVEETVHEPKFLLNSATLFLPLLFFLPLFFLTVHNLHMFKLSDVLHAFAFILAACIGFALIGFVFDLLVTSLKKYNLLIYSPLAFVSQKNIEQYKKNIPTVIFTLKFIPYIVIVSLAVYLLFKYVIDLTLYLPEDISLHLYILGSVLVVFVLIVRFNYICINLFLLLFLCITSLNLPLKLLDYYNVDVSALFSPKNEYKYSNHPVIEQAFLNFPLDEKLQNKPNIYFFYLESHHDFETQKKSFGIDTTPMKKTLTDSGFKIYDGVFSNAPGTFPSLLTLYTMQPDYNILTRGFADMSSSGYDIFAGSTDNLLFSFLKQQGYYIASYIPWSRLKNKYELLDYSFAIDENLSDPLENVLKIIMPQGYSKFIENSDKPKKGYNFLDISNSFDRKQPVFTIVYCNWLHYNESIIGRYSNYKDFISSQYYQDQMKKANEEILFYIDKVKEHDPNALVVLMGDHGYRFAIHEDFSNASKRVRLSSSELAQDLTLKMSPLEVAKDTFGTLLAVKMPKDAIQDISYNKTLSHANLFKHIFAALDNNPKYLENVSENISYSLHDNKVSVRNGIVEPAQSKNVFNTIMEPIRNEKIKQQNETKDNILKAMKANIPGIYLNDALFSQIQLTNCTTPTMDSATIRSVSIDPMMLLPSVKADEHGKIVFATKMVSSLESFSQLFFAPVGEGFSEKNSIKLSTQKGENYLYFIIEAEPNEVMQLRFDPSGHSDTKLTFQNLN